MTLMTPLAPARERLRVRKEFLGVEAKKSLGQNFLVSDHVIQKILQSVAAFGAASLVEVGPGLGALTDGLRAMPGNLTLIELDSVLARYWREQGAHVIEADALRWDWDLSALPRPCVFVSNLPYQISSSIVIERCLDPDPVDGMILMFQKEVAQRLRATPKDDAYGFLSVMAQTFWKTEMLLEASSHDFDPPPKVASRVVVFRPRGGPLPHRRKYLRFLKACFLQPRKLLVSNIAAGLHFPKEEAQKRLVGLGLDPKVRGDQLPLEKFLELFRLFENDMKA